MEEKIIKIQAPEGYEIDRENSTLDKIVFKKIEKKVEKKVETYDEVAEKLFKHKYGYYLTDDGETRSIRFGGSFNKPNDATTEEQLEWLMALNKLQNVAVYLNEGWVPDWRDGNEKKYILYYSAKSEYVGVHFSCDYNFGNVYFKSRGDAYKALEILGEETIKTALGVYKNC